MFRRFGQNYLTLQKRKNTIFQQKKVSTLQPVLIVLRWIKTKEKAKVVTAIWGTKLIQFLAALAVFHQDDLKKG